MTDDRRLSRREIYVRRMDSVIGAEITGAELSRPLEEPDFSVLREALHRHSLLLIRGQSFTPSSLAEFARRFGPLRRYKPLQPRSKKHAERYLCEDKPDIMKIGNLKVNGKPTAMFTNTSSDWHIDDLYKAHPNEATALFAVQTPSSGGDTLFIGLQAAYEALDNATKQKIKHLRCVYSVQRLDALHRRGEANRHPLTNETIAANPPVSHPLVRVHPVTKKKGLLFAPEVVPYVEGMSEETSQALVKSLADHALSPRFQYRHRWRDGDFLIWDNLSTMHCATEFDAEHDQRLLYRAIISRVR